MKKINVLLLAIVLAFIPSVSFAISNAELNEQLSNIQSKKFSKIEKYLNDNKTKLASDPEYFVLLLNYVMWKGDRSGVVVAKGKPSSGDLELRDQDTGEVVGFVGSREAYDDALMIDGIRRTQKAIKEFNSRLDIHFGIIAVAERIKRWDIVGEIGRAHV